jgi:predicted lipid-binding transport protein (Tim44 family)
MMVALIGLSLVAIDVEAKRLGGGRNLGLQRQATPPPAQKPPAQQAQQPQQAQPGQQQAAGQTAAAPAPQPAAAAAPGTHKWLGPLAGLALGAGLAALFLNNGIAGLLAGVLLIAALVAAVVFAARLLRGRAPGAPIQYAGAGADGAVPPAARPPLAAQPAAGAAPHSVAATLDAAQPAATRWPADFDAAEFVRHAKRNFVRLQAAHDARDLEALRDVMSPSLYREIEADLETAGAAQKTDVVTLEAEVIDVATQDGYYIVSVRFDGLIRESAQEPAQPFVEIWHLQKPVNGRSGWLIVGIQQA